MGSESQTKSKRYLYHAGQLGGLSADRAMTDLLTGLARVRGIEGAIFALFPRRMRGLLEIMLKLPDHLVRRTGVVALALGGLAVWLIRG
jgi:uncharacterized protein YjeT (DUF2065 family)